MLHWWSFLQGQNLTAPQITFSANPWCSTWQTHIPDPPMHSLSSFLHGSLGETRIRREVIILNYSFLNTPFTPTPKEHKSRFQSCHFSLGHTWRETRGGRAPFPPIASETTRDQNIQRISPFSTFLSRMFSLKSIFGHVPAVSVTTVPFSCCPQLAMADVREGPSPGVSSQLPAPRPLALGHFCCLLCTYSYRGKYGQQQPVEHVIKTKASI